MSDLTDFLLARIAEDEAWAESETFPQPFRFEAARVLAECEAKRRIVDRCERDMVAEGESASGYDIIAHTDALARDTLEFLALPYADHPDYREEWRL